MTSFRKVSPNRTINTAGVHNISNDSHDPPYVIHMVTSTINININDSTPKGTTIISCALSNGNIITYNGITMHPIHVITTNNSSLSEPKTTTPATTIITDVQHGEGESSQGTILSSSSSDGTIRLFHLNNNNTSTKQQNCPTICNYIEDSIIAKLPRNEIPTSLSLGCGGSLLCVGGSKGNVHFLDLRHVLCNKNGRDDNDKAKVTTIPFLGSYVDAHSEMITKVRFARPPPSPLLSFTTNNSNENNNNNNPYHPPSTNILLTTSEDGLICIHDTSKSNESLALISVLNAECSVYDANFFGPSLEGVYALTGVETMIVFHYESGQLLGSINGSSSSDSAQLGNNSGYQGTTNDLRGTLSQSIGFDITYLVGCHWGYNSNSSVSSSPILTLLAGNADGDGAVFRIDGPESSPVPLFTFQGGHRASLRSFVVTCTGDSNTSNTLFTGGEDGRLCEYVAFNTLPHSSSSISSSTPSLSGFGGRRKKHHTATRSSVIPQHSTTTAKVGGGVIRRGGKSNDGGYTRPY